MLERLRSLRRLFAAGGVLALLAALVLALPAHADGPAVRSPVDAPVRRPVRDDRLVGIQAARRGVGPRVRRRTPLRWTRARTSTPPCWSPGRTGPASPSTRSTRGRSGRRPATTSTRAAGGLPEGRRARRGPSSRDIVFSFPPDACPTPDGDDGRRVRGRRGQPRAVQPGAPIVCQAPQSLSATTSARTRTTAWTTSRTRARTSRRAPSPSRPPTSATATQAAPEVGVRAR